MSTPPGSNQRLFESPENKDSAPLYHSTDGFIPLGFSTPQHRNSAQNDNASRNYYSAQPKYMLPKLRGYRNQGRFQQQQQHRGGTGPPEKSSPGREDARGYGSQDHRRNANNRNWKGQDYQRVKQRLHQKHNRFGFGFGHHQGKDNSKNDISDYFHPSMLEDPWAHLEQKHQHDKADCDSSDAGEAEGDAASSDVNED